MGWITAGTISPNPTDWQLIGLPLIYGIGQDVSLFRVSHDWTANLSPYGKAWMAGWFPGNHLALFDALYPYKGNSRLIYSPLPVAYQEAGYLERTIAIKADDRCRIYEEASWTVTVEYFLPALADPEIPELLDLTQVEEALDLISDQIENLTDSLFPEGG